MMQTDKKFLPNSVEETMLYKEIHFTENYNVALSSMQKRPFDSIEFLMRNMRPTKSGYKEDDMWCSRALIMTLTNSGL